jgi:hypothetical protein
MLNAILLMVATPAAAAPAEQPGQICKVVVDHRLESRRMVACGTAEQWQSYNLALNKVKRKAERDAIQLFQAYAAVGSGY